MSWISVSLKKMSAARVVMQLLHDPALPVCQHQNRQYAWNTTVQLPCIIRRNASRSSTVILACRISYVSLGVSMYSPETIEC